jgi:hypothetical protein
MAKNSTFDPHAAKALIKKIWHLTNQGAVVATNPADHQTGLPKAMTMLKNHFPPPAENPHQIQTGPAVQVKDGPLAKVPAKKDHLASAANLMESVPIVANQKAALAEETKKALHPKGPIAADRQIAMPLKEATAAKLAVTKKLLHQETNRIQAG